MSECQEYQRKSASQSDDSTPICILWVDYRILSLNRTAGNWRLAHRKRKEAGKAWQSTVEHEAKMGRSSALLSLRTAVQAELSTRPISPGASSRSRTPSLNGLGSTMAQKPSTGSTDRSTPKAGKVSA